MGRQQQQNQYSNMDQHHQRMGMDQMSMDRRMDNMDRHMSSNMRSNNMMGMDRQMYNNDQQQQQFGIDQYYKRDDFGNYAYGYANGNSEKYEVGNPQGGVKGYYTYVDSNNLNRRVEYIADDQGFRIIKEDGERFKREAEAEPNMMRMRTSYLDSSMMDDDMYQMERAMRRNGMSMNRRMFDRQMFDRDMSRDNMQMYRNVDMMQDRDMMNMRQMSDRQMSPNMMSNNRFFDMYDMSMPQMRMDDGILGERNTMSQRMEIERIPDNRVSYMLF